MTAITLNLTLPEQDAHAVRRVELKPRQAQAWLNSLPHGSLRETGRKLLDNLKIYNRLKVADEDRLGLMDVYAPTLAHVFEDLDATYGESTLPLNDDGRAALAMARQLRTECAYAYKILLKNVYSRLLRFGGKTETVLYAVRLAEQLVESIYLAYRSYTPVASTVWLELHRLFLFAQAEGWSKDRPAGGQYSLSDAYAEALLLAVADPYRLPPGEVAAIRTLARELAPRATLHQEYPSTDPNSHFLVPCDVDRGPKPLGLLLGETIGPNTRLLDANAVVVELRARLDRLLSSSSLASPGIREREQTHRTLQKAIQLWSRPARRTARRDQAAPTDARVAICYGLSAVSHFVSMEPNQAHAAEAEAIRAGINTPLIALPSDEVSKSYVVEEWDVVNQSVTGLRVTRERTAATTLTVGEVIGVKFLGKPRWHVGTVRWVTTDDNHVVDFGVHLLAPSAQTVLITPTSTSQQRQREGLWLAEVPVLSIPERLLAPPDTYSDLREYDLSTLHDLHRVRAIASIEQTPRYDLFEIQPR